MGPLAPILPNWLVIDCWFLIRSDHPSAFVFEYLSQHSGSPVAQVHDVTSMPTPTHLLPTPMFLLQTPTLILRSIQPASVIPSGTYPVSFLSLTCHPVATYSFHVFTLFMCFFLSCVSPTLPFTCLVFITRILSFQLVYKSLCISSYLNINKALSSSCFCLTLSSSSNSTPTPTPTPTPPPLS